MELTLSTPTQERGRGWFRVLGDLAKRGRRELRGWKAALTLLLDPSRLDQVFVLDEVLTEGDGLSRILDRVRADPRGVRALERRPRLGRVDLDELSALPEGTVGRVYADHMRRLGLDPAAIPEKPVWDDASYVRAHLYETHDLWHALTGFGADIAGEVGLQAFYAAQLNGRLPPLLVTGGLLHGLFAAPGDWDRRLAQTARGYTLGRASAPLFGIAWREIMTRPIEEVRAELSIRMD